MPSLNRVQLLGHIGRPPELKHSKAGKAYCRLNVATHRHWGGNESKEPTETTEWHSVFVWGTLAETCSTYLRKGALVFVEGSLSYWQVAQNSEGVAYKNAIQANSIKFLSFGGADHSHEVIEHLDNPTTSPDHNAVRQTI